MTAVLREGWRVNEEQIAVTALVDAALLPIAELFQNTGMGDGGRLEGNIKLLGERLEVLAKGLAELPPMVH